MVKKLKVNCFPDSLASQTRERDVARNQIIGKSIDSDGVNVKVTNTSGVIFGRTVLKQFVTGVII